MEHILHCREAGRVEAFHVTVDCLDSWMGEMETDPNLAETLSGFVHERGSESLEAIYFGRLSRLSAFSHSRNAIGWQRLLEGMVSV